MKKVLIFCLILLCTLSVFAADVAMSIKLHMTYGENGFSFKPNAGVWEPLMGFAVNGDVAGASFSFSFPNYDSIAFKFGTWVAPKDGCKITIGSDVNVSFKEGITSDTSYGNIEWSKDKSNYKIGFGYKPNYTNTGVKESNVFFAGEVNQFIVDKNFLHLDAITKLNVVEGKADLVSVISDAYWEYGEELKASVYSIKAFEFGWNEETYNNRRDYSWDGAYVTSTNINAITGGLRYKYYTQEDKVQYNGLYGYAWGNYKTNDGFIYQAEAEVGKTICLELGSTGTKTFTSGKTLFDVVYARADFDFTGDEVNAKLTEVYSKLTYGSFELNINFNYTPQLVINYNNKSSNTPETNGFFITPGVTFNQVGSTNNAVYGLQLGIDSLKKFHWNSELKTTVNF